jgi:putative DNA methylase
VIPIECRRIAEVDFPIAEVSKHAVREKSIRHGHPSTLHLWWARRPLASSRAMLLALLLPDPCDGHCPPDFKTKARQALEQLQNVGPLDEDLRRAILKFIGDFANWDLAGNARYVRAARELVRAAQPDEPPFVVDPFAGGGSIPLEALRLGCEASASDLNPVACLILKATLEDIPRHGPNLAEELRSAGATLKRSADEDLRDLYPTDPDGATPIVYLWARTVCCESPNCGTEIPLVRTLWLCKKPNRRRALRPRVVQTENRTQVEFEVFEPTTADEVSVGTVARARASCVACGSVLAPERVRAQLASQRGGADVVFDHKGKRSGGARMLAVVTLRDGETGRLYRPPNDRDYDAIRKANERLAATLDDWRHGGGLGMCPVPDEPLPPIGTLGFRVQRYGMLQWGDLFTARQKVGLRVFASIVHRSEQGPLLQELLGLTLDHTVERFSSLCRWSSEPYMETVLGVFGRQALPMIWDFAEPALLSESTGSFLHGLRVKAQALQDFPALGSGGNVHLGDARESPLPDESASVWFTDPPYYDAIPYSDLSDFFFVWLKRALPARSLFREGQGSEGLTPKNAEIVQDTTKLTNGHAKDRAWFEDQMAKAFAEGRRVLRNDGIGCVVFAHKTTDGWEALLSGMNRGGWTISGSWPIATERANRLRSQDSAALATSVHLVCRPRPTNAPVGDWADVIRELPTRVGDWMHRLQREGVRGADLVFACIGPALEIYSRYSRVETAEGREIPLGGDPEATEPEARGFLAYVWEVVGRAALDQVLGTERGDVGLEEDARLVALFLWTLQSSAGVNGNGTAAEANEHEAGAGRRDDEDEDGSSSAGSPKGYALVYDVVRRFAQPLGIGLPEWEAARRSAQAAITVMPKRSPSAGLEYPAIHTREVSR